MRPLLGVLYARGAAGPAEIVESCRNLCDVVLITRQPADPALEAIVSVHGARIVGGLDDRQMMDLGLSGLVTFAESEVRAAAGIAHRLRLRSNSPAAAELLTDKHEQRLTLSASGLPGPTTTRHDDLASVARQCRVVSGDHVLKPVHGEGSRSTVRIAARTGTTERDLVALGIRPADGVAGWVLEQYIEDDPAAPGAGYVSVEAVVSEGLVAIVAITGKLPTAPPFRETGQYLPADLRTETADAVKETAVAALRALGVTCGVAHIEIKLTRSGPVVIEVNGRLGGLVNGLVRRHAGVDLIAEAARAALGLPIVPADPRVRAPRIVFAASNLAPLDAVRLRSVSGARLVRAVPGIKRYTPLCPPGYRLREDLGTEELDVLQGDAADTAAMHEALRAALGLLRFVFESANGSIEERSGMQLPSTAALAGTQVKADGTITCHG